MGWEILQMAPMKHLVSLEEHDAELRASVIDPLAEVSLPNGIICPNKRCGHELMDTHPNRILMTNPPTKSIHCIKCNFKGSRLA